MKLAGLIPLFFGIVLTLGCGGGDDGDAGAGTAGSAGSAAAAGGGTAGQGGSGGSDGSGSTGSGANPGSGGSGASAGSGGGGGDSGSGGTAGAGGTAGGGGSSGVDAGGGSAGAGSTTCANGATCVPPPPSGWSALVKVLSAPGQAPPACPGGSSPLATAHTDIAFEPAKCGACVVNPPVCNMKVTLRRDASMNGCGGCKLETTVPKSCGTPLWPSDCTSGGAIGIESMSTYRSCTGTVSEKTVAPPVWSSTYALCGATGVANCDGGTCIEAASGATCIFREGTALCPAPFSTAKTLFKGFTDNRQCSCSSSSQPGGCAGTLEIFDDESCSTAPVSLSTCTQIATKSYFEKYGVSYRFTPTSTGTCSGAMSVESYGSVKPSEPLTVCCL